ncbi:MAG: TRAP transporter substrate-binding protein [Arcanobacterium sp.]|nr:TRAP transporter substrate-binding protein [Arcanobacterium sp.]
MKLAKSAAVIAAVALGLSACSGGNSDSSAGGATETKVVRIGSNWAASHPMAKAIDEVFVPEVEKATNGALDIEVHHSGALGNEADLWDGVRNGTIEAVLVGTPMNQEFSTMLISDWPFLYRDLDHAKKVWTGEVAEEVSASFAEAFPTTKILGWGPNSARTFSSKKELTNFEQFKGQKFRMPQNPIHIGLAEGFGASAQVILLGELFTALETGVVDGQDNGMVTIISEGFNEVQKYVYETNHIIATLEFIVNAGFFDGLTAEQQEIVSAAAKKASESAWDNYIASVDTDRKFLQDNGVTVTQPTAEDLEKMQKAIEPLVEKLYAENDWAKELTDKIRAVK